MDFIQPLSDSAKKQKYLKQLKAEDSHIVDIIGEASHVDIYQFDPSKSKWDKRGVAGTAFVVRRDASPVYNIFVLNKSGPDNFTLAVSAISKAKLQPPYIMTKCSTEGAPIILGFWVHDDEARQQLMDLMQTTMEASKMIEEAAGQGTAAAAALPKPRVVVTAPKAEAAAAAVPAVKAKSKSSKEAKTDSSDFLTDKQISAKKSAAVALGASSAAAAAPTGAEDILSLAQMRLQERKEQQKLQQQQQQQEDGASSPKVHNYHDLLQQQQQQQQQQSSSSLDPGQKLLAAIAKPQPRTPPNAANKSGLSIALTPPSAATSSTSSVSPSLLLSPSDITGVRRKFLKQ